VSLGPGFPDYIIPRARTALDEAQVVVGYRTYIDLLKPLLTHQEVVVSGMKAEVQRCRLAIERARAGQKVALVSSGDAGIYGMAGLVLEICGAQGIEAAPPEAPGPVDFHLEMIPGVPALAAGAALLGAPLMHDFASISLSDLLTPWEIIKKRLEAAAQGDFVIVLYNPKSKKRDWQLSAVRDLLLGFKDPDTPVGSSPGPCGRARGVIATWTRSCNIRWTCRPSSWATPRLTPRPPTITPGLPGQVPVAQTQQNRVSPWSRYELL
jgi:precorrin-3B C17-methyltransferase